MNTNRKTREADYMTPVCTSVDISSEGVLCTSGDKAFTNESFEDIINYGTDGWN